MTNVEPGHLGNFLLSQNEQLLQDLKAGRGKGWIVSNGNEAGGAYY
jgi:hypothetical protein